VWHALKTQPLLPLVVLSDTVTYFLLVTHAFEFPIPSPDDG
jgi:hypothetical protein